MNKNKGFIGIGLILAIVLGIVIVGGGAYYLGKSGSKQAINNPENNLPNNQNQNLPVDNNQQAKCDSNSAPSITVLSPNGGETYTAGQKITVKWSSCNIPVGVDIGINLFNQSKTNPLTNISHELVQQTKNDGSEVVSLLPQKNMPTFINGNLFKISMNYVFTNDYTGPMPNGHVPEYQNDESDNLFTINSATKNVSTTDLKTYTNTEGNKVPYDILPNEYVSLQNGSWPFIKSLPVSYSCNISNGYGDVPTVIKESIINGRKYCIESTTEGAAGSSYTTYSYKTNNNMGGSTGIKSLNFTLRSANCGVFRDNSTSGGIKYNECLKAQAEVNLKLNIIVDSIMFL